MERNNKGRFIKGHRGIPLTKGGKDRLIDALKDNTNGFKIGDTPWNKLSLDEDKIVKMYKKENLSGTKIAKELKCSDKVIYDILKKQGVKIKSYSEAQRGKKITKDTRINMRQAQLKRKERDGYINSIVARKKLSKTKKDLYKKGKIIIENKFRGGEEHPNWKGGTSFEPYDKSFNNKFKRAIRKRDNQVCMNCGVHREKLKKALHIHHIDYNKKLTIPQNCISLCNQCHSLTHFNREYWTKVLQKKLSKLYDYQYSNDKVLLDLNKITNYSRW